MTMNVAEKLEQSLIGALLVSPEKIVDISDKVKPTDFTDTRAMTAYTAILNEYTGRKAVNIATVANSIPQLAMYLAESTNDAYVPGVVRFAEEISDTARLRRVRTGLEAAVKAASADSMLAEVMGLYNKEMSRGHKAGDIKSVIARVNEVVRKNRTAGQFGFSSGFKLWKNIYYRYFPGHIITVGGFTSVGKTAVMVQKICNMITSGEGAKIVLISTEMTEEQVVARIISNFTGVHSMRILSGNFHSAEEEDSVEQIKNSLKNTDLTIYDDIYQLDDIETAFRRKNLQGGVDVGFIDYVQNCRWAGAKSEYQEQSTLAKRVQSLAKEVGAAIVCLSQVSNDVGRGNTDQLELKGAGEWAAVSDLGIMLQRHKTEKHRVKYMIKKNRHGALGECGLDFTNEFTSLLENWNV